MPNVTGWQEPVVSVGDRVVKGQLLARGITHIYFQANGWILFGFVFLIGSLMGFGTAAVLKHISDYYPNEMGKVGGIVGVIGGLGGFFNPIVFGYLLSITGLWTSCWVFLFIIGGACLIIQRLAIARTRTNKQ